LWAAQIGLPPNVSVRKVHRGGDSGYGVDLKIKNHTIDVNVWDDDGDAFFMLRHGNSFCKVDVGSDGQQPGFKLEVFEQHGLVCSVASGIQGSKQYTLTLLAFAQLDGNTDCDSTTEGTENGCDKVWRAPQAKASLLQRKVSQPIALWAAQIGLPPNVSVRKVHRGGDSGYGVDLKIKNHTIDVNVWDDDGDAFFMLRHGNSFCKVDVGSDGQQPGFKLEVFEQHGLVCSVASGIQGSKQYTLTLLAFAQLDGNTDCDSTTEGTENGCDKVWRAPTSIFV